MSSDPSNVLQHPLPVALRAMVIRLGGTPSTGPIPDCGVSEHELRTECSRFRLPEYCTLCERNPANR